MTFIALKLPFLRHFNIYVVSNPWPEPIKEMMNMWWNATSRNFSHPFRNTILLKMSSPWQLFAYIYQISKQVWSSKVKTESELGWCYFTTAKKKTCTWWSTIYQTFKVFKIVTAILSSLFSIIFLYWCLGLNPAHEYLERVIPSVKIHIKSELFITNYFMFVFLFPMWCWPPALISW